MRVLALTHRTPFPPDKGDKIRTHHLLTRLASRCELHLAAFAEPPSDVAHAARLRRDLASVTLVPLDMRWQKLRALPALLGSSPLTLPVFYRRAMQRAVDERVRDLRPDVVFAESTSMAPYALAWPELPLLMDFVDVDSAKWSAYADEAAQPRRAVFRREARTLAAYERRVATHARISTVTADRERALLAEIAPDADVRTLPNGVDTRWFTPRAAAPARPSVVFFGAMDYDANVEAAVFLVREVLPRLRAWAPDTTAVIAGSRPTDAVRALASVPGVTVTGYVQDIRPWVTGASVCAIPLRVARGVQNKVLEAMAMGVPVVCSPAAAEGIDAADGEHLRVAPYGQGGAPTADAVRALLEAPDEAAALAARGRARVEARYGWDPRADELHAMLREAAR